MTKSKRSLKNTANPAFHSLILFILTFFIFGCAAELAPSYKESDIPYHIKKICKNEYGLDVVTKASNNSLWIYAPLQRIIHKDFPKDKNKLLDDAMVEKLRNIIITVGRVFLSADKAPEFYCLVASDVTEIGIDYTLIGYVLDIKKTNDGYIPWNEANRRYVVKIEINPEALNDNQGEHIKPYDIQLGDFLAEQISQRSGAYFQEATMKKLFKIEKLSGRYSDETFFFDYTLQSLAKSEFKVKDKLREIITYVLKSYEFKNFLMVEIKDMLSENKLVLSKATILGLSQP